jgi:hypothetical protein
VGLGDAGADGVAGDYHDDCELPEDFSVDPGLGFSARMLAAEIAAGKIPAAKLVDTQRLIFNSGWMPV